MQSSQREQKRESLEKVISFKSYIALGLGIIVGIGWVVYSGQWLTDGSSSHLVRTT